MSEYHFECVCGAKVVATMKCAKCSNCGRHMEIQRDDPSLYGNIHRPPMLVKHPKPNTIHNGGGK